MSRSRASTAIVVALLAGYFIRAGAELTDVIRLAAPLLMVAAFIFLTRYLERGDPPPAPDDPWREAADE